jgi:hypothetical protein
MLLCEEPLRGHQNGRERAVNENPYEPPKGATAATLRSAKRPKLDQVIIVIVWAGVALLGWLAAVLATVLVG